MTRNELESLADLHESENEANMKIVIEILSSMTVNDWELYISVWFCRFKNIIENTVENNTRFGFTYRLMLTDDYCLEFKFKNRFNSISLHEDNHAYFAVNIKSNRDEILLVGRSNTPHNNFKDTVMEKIYKPFGICMGIDRLHNLIKHLN